MAIFNIQIIMHSEYMEVYNERFRSQMIRCNSSLFIMIYWKLVKEGANKQVISSQADSLIKISRIWADFFPANTSN
ncbi:hypothetical protein CLQ68_00020 (plasmid) [Klebsiella pneumoniae]|nr:hypothetical protein CLQ68_00020 [Klebsiella pneumoniae]